MNTYSVKEKADSALVVSRFGETQDKVVYSVNVGTTTSLNFKAAVRGLVLETKQEAVKKVNRGMELR